MNQKQVANKVECSPGNNENTLQGSYVAVTKKRVEELLLRVQSKAIEMPSYEALHKTEVFH